MHCLGFCDIIKMYVTVEVLVKICTALDCGIDDIMELVPENKQVV